MESITDAEYLKETYAKARNKYEPSHINTLLIAEAPPCNLDRFFYFEDVKKTRLPVSGNHGSVIS